MNDSYPLEAEALMPNGERIALRCVWATGFAQRFFGLMGKKSVPAKCGLAFDRCRSVHMMFMRVPLDVLWLASGDGPRYKVAGLSKRVMPWRVAMAPRGGSMAVEFESGTFNEAPLSVLIGDEGVT